MSDESKVRLTYIDVCHLCKDCKDECGGSSCEVWRHSKEAAPEEIVESSE